MKFYKTIIYIQLIVIVLLGAIMFTVVNQEPNKEKAVPNNNSSIITNFDRADFDRVNDMVKRFNANKGDNLMLISPTIDSGPWIHDVISNGNEITWIVDNTRDGMSANTRKTEYVCKAVEMTEKEEHFVVELSKCNSYKDDEKLGLITFRKEQL